MTPEQLRERTRQFAGAVVRFSRSLPRDPRRQELAAQLVDAATGVGANYRSVCRARSRADFINKLAITIECADEALYWLELLIASETGDRANAEVHGREAEELTKILSASRATARRNRGGPGLPAGAEAVSPVSPRAACGDAHHALATIATSPVKPRNHQITIDKTICRCQHPACLRIRD